MYCQMDPYRPMGTLKVGAHITKPVLGSFIGSDVTVRALRSGGPALICRRAERIIRSIDRRAAGQ